MTTSVTTLSSSEIIVATFNMGVGATTISVPGLKVGDLILSGRRSDLVATDDINGFQLYLERMISVDDQIQQLDPFGNNFDLTAYEVIVYILRTNPALS